VSGSGHRARADVLAALFTADRYDALVGLRRDLQRRSKSSSAEGRTAVVFWRARGAVPHESTDSIEGAAAVKIPVQTSSSRG